MNFETTIEREGEDISVTVEFTMSKGYKGARDTLCSVRRAGPPLEPDEPPEAEITSVKDGQGVDYVDDLTPNEEETILEKCYEYVRDNAEL